MSTYCTSAGMADRYGTNEMGQFTAPAVTRAIADAGDEIDAFVGSRYTLPLATVPPLLERLACDIARFRLYSAEPTDEVRQRYEDAVSTLRAVATGTASLGVAPADAPTAAPGGVSVAARSQVFTPGLMGMMPS